MFKELTIKEVAKIINGATKMPNLELVRGISIDSRTTRPGELFFALKGKNSDGHLYTKEALAKGAVGVVVQKETGVAREIIVADTLFGLGELGRAYRSRFKPITIGIAGTNGKTTVKNLIAAILKKRYRVLASRKSYNSLIGLPLTILDLTGSEDYLVLEMGTSSPGEIKRLCEIGKPSIGLVTNIGPGHLQGLGSIEGVRKEESSLIESLPRNGLGIIGEGVDGIPRDNIHKFSMDMLDDIGITEQGSYFTYQGTRFFTQLLGLGNIYNCLASLVLTSKIGIELQAQKEAICQIKAEPGRLEPIPHKGLFIINDTYNANPVSMKTAIDFLSITGRPKVCVLGDMLELGKESSRYHKEIGRYAKERCNLFLCYGREAHHYGGKEFQDKDALISFLIKNLQGNEAILFKASRSLRFEELVGRLLKRY